MKCPHCKKKLRLRVWAWNGVWHEPYRNTPVYFIANYRWRDCYFIVCRKCGEPVS